MANTVGQGKRFTDFPVANSTQITGANTWMLVQDNLPNSNGSTGNTYRLSPYTLAQMLSNGSVVITSVSSNTAIRQGKRYTDFPLANSSQITANSFLIIQDNLPNSNGSIGNTYRITPADLTTAGGTVSSVALTAPADFVISGSPVTTAGTIAVTRASQAPNVFLGGPASGNNATPTYRAIVLADIPTIPWSRIEFQPTTLAGYGITDAQPLNGDLTAIAAIGTNGYLQRTGTNTWSTSVTIPAASVSGLALVATSGSYDDLSNKPTIPSGATNLSESANSTAVTIASDTGTDAIILTANSTAAGVITAANQTKLDGISAGAQVNVPTNLSESANSTTVTIASDTGTDAVIPTANSTVAGVITAANQAKLDSLSGGGNADNLNGGATNDIPYQTAASTTGFVAAADNSVLVTNGTGVPALSRTLPNSITAPFLVLDQSQYSWGNISAAGTDQASATVVATDYAEVTAGTGGVQFQGLGEGRIYTVDNRTSSNINVYPQVNNVIDNLATNAPVVLPPGCRLQVIGVSSTAWRSSMYLLTNTSALTGTLAAAQFPALTGAVTTTAGSLSTSISASGVTAGTYGDSTHVAQFAVGADGRVTSVSNIAIATSGAGTVTSVGLTVPSWLSVSGSPVTGAGTIAVSAATQVKNTVLIGPVSGADAAPTFRALVAADVSAVNWSAISGAPTTLAGYGITDGLKNTNNLSDVSNVATARTNLGLATVANSGSYTDLTNIPSVLPSYIPIHTAQTAAYTFVLADAGACTPFNVSSAVNATIPTNANVAFPIGTRLYVRQTGSAATTIVGASGVTLDTLTTAATTKIGDWLIATKVDTDTWDVQKFLSSVLATVAVSGSYNDLSNKPTIPSGITNLSESANTTTVTIASDTGADAVITTANSTVAGVITAANQTKLDGIAAGAQVNVPTNLSESANSTTVTIASDTGADAVITTANSTVAGVITAANQTKLDGIAAGAQVNVPTNITDSANSTTVTIISSTGTDAVITTANSTVAGVITAANQTKLDGIAVGAEVNVNADWNASSGDAQILNKPSALPSYIPINAAQTAAYTFVLTDANSCTPINSSSALNITIPTNASVAFPIGTRLYIRQNGSGADTLVGASGVTLNSLAGVATFAAGDWLLATKVATDSWDIQRFLAYTPQPSDADLTAVAALSTTGYAKRTGSATWTTVTTIPSSDVTGLGNIAIVSRTSTSNAYALTTSDVGVSVEPDTNTTSVTIDASLFNVGDVGLIRQIGSAQITISASSGTTIDRYAATAKFGGQYAWVNWQVKANTSGSAVVYVNGELAAS